LKEKREQ
jgi:hypothetical protein